MPRVTRIDRADAFRAIETIIARGEAPTHVNVRAELGQRGSPPVISNFISSWFACYGATLAGTAQGESSQPVPSASPAATMESGAIAALTAAALEQIQQAAAGREAEHRETMQADLNDLARQRADLQARIDAFDSECAIHSAHIERAYADRDAALKERDLALADAASLRSALSLAKQQIAQHDSEEGLIDKAVARAIQSLKSGS